MANDREIPIKTRPATPEYRANFDRIFKKKRKAKPCKKTA
jgi:hypothetical protein